MTKIPSIEERVEEYSKKNFILETQMKDPLDAFKVVTHNNLQEEWLTKTFTADRTALLTELRDSGLLDETEYMFEEGNKKHIEFESSLEHIDTKGESFDEGHNTLARAIKAHINNLINPPSV